MCKLRFGLLLVIAGVAAPQSPAPKASFDVASIKLHPGPITFSADPAVQGRTVTGTASTLLDLITTAYGVRYEQISGGPNWMNSDHYDLAAKAEGEGTLTKDQARQGVYGNLFGLAVDFELKAVCQQSLKHLSARTGRS